MQKQIDKNTHCHVNIRIISICIFILASIISCNKNEESIPSYISISTYNLNTNPSTEGVNTNNITDVWVYANDQFRGAFESIAKDLFPGK